MTEQQGEKIISHLNSMEVSLHASGMRLIETSSYLGKIVEFQESAKQYFRSINLLLIVLVILELYKLFK